MIVKQEETKCWKLNEVFPSKVKKQIHPNDKLNGLSYKLWAPHYWK